MNNSIFRGTGVALVTPFRNHEIDFTALETLIEHTINGGVDFLVSLGTTGEAVTLSEEEQSKIIEFTKEKIAGRVPLVVGVFGGSDTHTLAKKAKSFDFQGIDALLCASPAYNKPTQEGIFQHFMHLAEALPKPIILYNVPGRTASNMMAETTLRLANASDKFIGIKEASNNLVQVTQIIRDRPEGFLVLSGDDFITLPLIASGADGVISVIGNTLPRVFSDMVRSCLEGDFATANINNLELQAYYQLLFSEGNPSGVKAALSFQKICLPDVRLPLVPQSEAGTLMLYTEFERLSRIGLAL